MNVDKSSSMEWNDDSDLAEVRKALEQWTQAVIRKDRATIESFHDDGFLVTLPDGTLLSKDGHIALELAAGMKQMTLTALRTRRCGDLILAWGRHHMIGTEAPSIRGTSLRRDWVPASTMQQGYEQADFSVWRRTPSGLKCLAFELTMLV